MHIEVATINRLLGYIGLILIVSPILQWKGGIPVKVVSCSLRITRCAALLRKNSAQFNAVIPPVISK